MIANGIPVCEKQQAALIGRMKQGNCRTSDLVDTAESVGFRRVDGTAQRVASHIISTERRAGRLTMIDGRWLSKNTGAAA